MVDIQSKEVIDKISEDLKIQPALQIPRAIAEKIQLVYGVNPRRIGRTANAGGTGATIAVHTAHATKDTWVTSAHISLAKTALNTGTVVDFRYTSPEGATEALIKISLTTLTVGNRDVNISFPTPILIAKGSSIAANINNATGLRMDAGISFYETDPQ